MSGNDLRDMSNKKLLYDLSSSTDGKSNLALLLGEFTQESGYTTDCDQFYSGQHRS